MIANGYKNSYYYQPLWWIDDYYVEWGISTGSYSYEVYADSSIIEIESHTSIYMSSYYCYSLISTAVTV